MTRGANGLLFVALLVCGAGDPAHAEGPGNGDGDAWRQPAITARRPAAEDRSAPPQALRCRRLFGCLPTGFSPLDINRGSKGTDHD
jgi:hypothetical protein